jgi:hypothetical protein
MMSLMMPETQISWNERTTLTMDCGEQHHEGRDHEGKQA